MSAKHTPGPWTTLPEECHKPYVRIRGTRLGGRYKVANVLTPIYEGVHERDAEETRANARLIAAAPDLLAALQALISEYGGSIAVSRTDERALAAHAALNKAIWGAS
jgi:hypothetical protein